MADHTHHTTLDGTVVASMPSTSDRAVARAASLSTAVAEMARVRSGREEPVPFVLEVSTVLEDPAELRASRRSLFTFGARARAAVELASFDDV
ncbi:MAG: hypothetical protein H7123_01735 [Thermoleophilia bacterium]|nr:hypothetical protein [Thermoleophilia bacterium]